jgi:hypothetical protein
MTLCHEKHQLTEEYNIATAAYSQSVSELFASIGVIPKAQYQQLRTATEEARLASADARDQLERHIADHGC